MTTDVVNPVVTGNRTMDLLARMISEQNARDAADQREAGEYSTVISAKQARDRQAFAEFRTIDERRYEQSVKNARKANLQAAENGVRDAREHVRECDPRAALEAFRHAEDRFLEADADAKALSKALEDAKAAEAAPAEITRARLAAAAARDTAGELRDQMESARGAKDSAETRLAEAKAELAEAERDLAVAQRNAGEPPGTAPLSRTTMKNCGWYIMGTPAIWNSLSRHDQATVLEFIQRETEKK